MKSSSKIWANMTLGVLLAAGAFALSGQSVAQEPVEKVQTDADALRQELEKVRNEKAYQAQQVEQMRLEREQFSKEIRRVENLNQKYTKEIENVRTQMAEQQAKFEQRIQKMEADMADRTLVKAKPKTVEKSDAPAMTALEVEKQANEVLQKGGDLDPEDEKFKEELARAHYNMGNVYFERGEYQRSVVEYYQAVDLMPYDADAHYNLAFVSGEYIGDQETALKHYQWYLYLKPNAPDRKAVEEKIVASKLHGRSQLPMVIDRPEETGHLNIGR